MVYGKIFIKNSILGHEVQCLKSTCNMIAHAEYNIKKLREKLYLVIFM